jgi:hypothetical protein
MGNETAATKKTAADLQTTTSKSHPAAGRSPYNIFPALTWLRAYQPKWLRADLVAGVTLAAYLMPAGLADASLANLPPEAKRRARLNCLAHILNLIPYKKLPREKVKLPKRSMKGAYDDQASRKGRKLVPEKY